MTWQRLPSITALTPTAAAAPPSSFKPSPPPPPSQRSTTHIPSHIYSHPYAILLELCTSLTELHQVLPLVFKSNLHHHHLFHTKLLSLFSKFNSLPEATRVFDHLVPQQDRVDVLYHTMLKGYALNSQSPSSLENALSFFIRMNADGVRPVVYNFSYLLKACAANHDLRTGKQIHGQVIVNGYASNLISMNGVVNLYAKCRLVNEARKMFDRMPERDRVCWNTMIGGYSQNRVPERALELFVRMQGEEDELSCKPDLVTVVSVLPACADIGSLWIGKSVHGYVVKAGFGSLVNVSTALIDVYSKCGCVGTARYIFESMQYRNVVSWNSMIDGYTQNGDSKEALELFQQMLNQQVEPTNVTIMKALSACADLGDIVKGEFTHKLLCQLELSSDVSVMNSLISMYCKCKRVDVAAEIFENLQGKTLVSWNAMLLGYAQNGRINEALKHFCSMHQRNIIPDSFTMVSVIPALAELAVLRQAKWMHGLVTRTCFSDDVFVMTAVVDMYAKCGAVNTARKLFDMMDKRHVTTWNAMIDGYGSHGLGTAMVELFSEMRKGDIKPNGITFLSIISGCSHSGLVEEGRSYFTTMKEDYGLEPSMDHYGAMVDLLGRAGQLNKAWDFIQNMPIEPGINVYGAMLGACKIHKNVDIGKKAADKLFELDPQEGGYHVLLANIYTRASMWDEMAKVRTSMEKKGLQKTPGFSLVDLRNEVHTFYSGSTSHPQSKEVYGFLKTLIDEIKAAGYVPDNNSIRDVDEHVQEQLLSSHSEKLAIAFGLLNTSPGTTIHIRKNLRVCGDCHNATKYISLVTGREIIVRDMQRFHHFKSGSCSCGDYW